MHRGFLIFLCGALVLCGCDDDETDTAGPGGGAGGMGGGGGTADIAPTPEDISFNAVTGLPFGEQILFVDWSMPDRLLTMAPDGTAVVEIFNAFRIWSIGVSRARDKVAFACGDPLQLQHYGVGAPDAIQNTWVYDITAQSAEVVSYGNINDECHHWGPGDTHVYVCRRHDFAADGETAVDYRVGAVEIATKTFDWVMENPPDVLSLRPQITADGATMFFERIVVDVAFQTRQLWKRAQPDGVPELVRDEAFAPVLSPGGIRYLWNDALNGNALMESDLDGSNPVMVADVNARSVSYSPDGTRVVYLAFDSVNLCNHVEVAAVDGSQVSNPTRIRDCVTTGEFVRDLSWITR